MSRCEPLRTMLYRVAEGEATPEEAMRAARHLPHCTACRIVLARERRLAEMLEVDLEDRLQVDDAFVRSVMDHLPDAPPRPRKRRSRRVLKLAALAGLLTAPWLAMPGLRIDLPGASLPQVGAPDLDGAERLLQAAFGVGQWLALMLDAVATGLPGPQGVPSGLPGLALLVALPAAAGLVTVGALLALATGRSLKTG